MSLELIVHTCSCGRRYTAATWAALAFVGHTAIPPDPTEEKWPQGYVLEQRNCANCASTRSIELALAPTEPQPPGWMPQGLTRALAHLAAAEAELELLAGAYQGAAADEVLATLQPALRAAEEARAVVARWNDAASYRRLLDNYCERLNLLAVVREPRSAA